MTHDGVLATRVSAPAVVRRVGYYLLFLSALGVWGLVISILDRRIIWYQAVAWALNCAAGVGLVLERRWAYVLGVTTAAIDVAWVIVVMFVGQFQDLELGPRFGLLVMTVISLAIVLPPCTLLRASGRRWFLAGGYARFRG